MLRLPSQKTLGSLSVPTVLLTLVLLMRCWNSADVFVAGKTFFADPDCYSRMTRVQRVFEHPGMVIHRHEFENWPEGTQPHTTAPFDYLTAGLAGAMRVFTQNAQAALDLAGAWISPLFGVLTAAFLWFWARRSRIPVLIFFAVSPILVHGTALGRPDHQSLLLLCMAVALGAETKLWERPSRGWAIAGGLAWGLGLWVSLYEPGVLLAVALLLGVAAAGRDGTPCRPEVRAGGVTDTPRADGTECRPYRLRERAVWGAALAGVLLLAAFVDGWRSPVPEPMVRDYFANWSRTIGELSHLPVTALLRWTGWLLLAAPFLLIWLGWKRGDRTAWFWLGLLVALSALTCWQARWGYFLALVFAMSLPSLLGVFSKRWIALVVFGVSLWPLAVEWDQRLDSKNVELRAEQRMDNLALYDVAQMLKRERRLPVLAPWWQSPALAYWSGQPCVAGSSHESLPGTVDASRFYLSADPGAAEAILARRRVAWVVAYDPGRVIAVSSAILGETAPEGTMTQSLYEHPSSAPPFLKAAHFPNPAFRVFLRPEGLEP